MHMHKSYLRRMYINVYNFWSSWLRNLAEDMVGERLYTKHTLKYFSEPYKCLPITSSFFFFS